MDRIVEDRKDLILGTAGHIDHGKTALVKLLTGTDCDRLPEEKSRGITIELGFASLDLPGGTHLGVIDVPGHERFVRNMVAGASGLDIIMLVIAADEGVMPQTREHFDICRMLGVGVGLVALTKVDLVDAEWLELVLEDVRAFVEGSFLENAPLIPVSSATGEGKDALLSALAACAAKTRQKSSTDILRLPIDRVFTVKGFGTVVTGTLLAGSLRTGDELQLAPSGTRVRVRGVQVHGAEAGAATAGLRTAVNLQGLSSSELRRGDCLIAPGSLEPSYILDARVEVLAGAPRGLKARSRLRLHIDTSEIMARVYPMSAEEIEPGQGGIVQLRLEAPAVLLPQDRFVLRGVSPVFTIGGGVVLHPKAAKHRRPFDKVLRDLKVLETGELSERMAVFYARAGFDGLPRASLRGLLGASGKELQSAFRKLVSQGRLVLFDTDGDRAVAGMLFRQVMAGVVTKLEEHHRSRPESPGLSRGELAARTVYGIRPRLLARALSTLGKKGEVEIAGDTIRLAGHRAGFAGEMAALSKRVLGILLDAGFAPPTVKELIARCESKKGEMEKVLDHLVQSGLALRVTPSLYYEKTNLDRVISMTRQRLEEAGEIDAPSFKELTGLSRKFAIPLLEYFDALKLTLRVGDKRLPRKVRG